MIELESFGKRFGAVAAVDGLSLSVEAGEVFGLIGPDGAGKTTTMRVIATAMRPTSGRVTVGGLDVTVDPEGVKKLIGYMPQRFALYPDLTVLENLNFFADVFGSPRAQRADLIERLLGFARLSEYRGRRAHNLSGGMQKKLALAATLMHQPPILLLDEPTTGVDPVSRREFWDLLTRVRLDGVTIVISTPYLDEAERCTHVALMHQGQLVARDSPAGLRAGLGAIVLEGQATDAVGARKAVEHRSGVLSASAHGDVLRLLIDRAERMPELRAAWDAAAIQVGDMHPTRARLEDAFVLLLQGRMAQAGV
ncbi:MAG: ABC transporter ATP-binding protein [Chloroflexi bacterium]|nr:ABC transporter ATP-binding protein [Chloroflexota bacterium]